MKRRRSADSPLISRSPLKICKCVAGVARGQRDGLVRILVAVAGGGVYRLRRFHALQEFTIVARQTMSAAPSRSSVRYRVATLVDTYGPDAALPTIASALEEGCPRKGEHDGCFVVFDRLG